ncbi:MAG TPA: fumarylacetoacetate hydrolase family protein [Caulobacteraceae bacterium]|jgi:2-keto-4-pentenoate hydratase/2-oxohepta-3-ene-1,7-dioic acid hydratase in catechol pathway
MKIARCAADGSSFWAIVDVEAGTVRKIAGAFHEWAPAVTRGEGEAALRLVGEAQPLADVRLLPPVEKANKVVIVGANYAKHLVEFGVAAPAQPVAFLKSYGALIGANDPIRYPPLTHELDHEVELVAVIGAERVDHSDPLSSVLGYTVGNDVSARDVQRSGPAGIGMDLFGAKSQDRTTGVGPWIVTRDEFPPGQPVLRLILKVDGDVRQDGSSGDMTWPVEHLIRFADERSSLECGDIMFTGTPNGVGQGTGRYLNPGEVVEAIVEGVGALRNVVEREPA